MYIVIVIAIFAGLILAADAYRQHKNKEKIQREIWEKQAKIITHAVSELEDFLAGQQVNFRMGGFGALPIPALRQLLPVCRVIDDVRRATVGNVIAGESCEAYLGILLEEMQARQPEVSQAR